MNEVRHTGTLGVRITEGHVGKIAANGTHLGGFWLGGTDDLADERLSLDAFENHSDNWTGHHVFDIVAEDLLATTGNHLADVFVVLTIEVLIGHDHLHADNLEADAFETLDDFADNSPLDSIRLQHD